jgi:hypothetical protein
MAGHMGNEKVTIQGLEVVSVDATKNLMLIKGAVPGTDKGLVIIEQTVKRIKVKVARVLNKKEKAKKEAAAKKAKPAAKK